VDESHPDCSSFCVFNSGKQRTWLTCMLHRMSYRGANKDTARKLEAEAAAPSMDNVRRGSHPRASGPVDPAPIGHAIMAASI
jgi:hypothetical protein